MAERPKTSASTRAAQALGWLDPATNGVTPAIYPSTNFARTQAYEKPAGRGYTRDDNPTYDQAEALICDLEGGAAAMLFASGMAAATVPFQALSPGDHVVVSEVLYFGLRKWLTSVAEHWGLVVEFVPSWDTEAMARAVRPGKTKLVWVETPCNPTWDVTDIRAVADIAHDAGALLGVDSTAATPVLTQPLALGADMVMHSATKYLNGHGDVLAGVLITARDDDYWRRIGYLRFEGGAVLGPFEAWLLLRGMRTLFLRVKQSCAGAMAIARHFDGHARIEAVCYPGLESHAGHAVAARQMTGGFGGMLSLRVRGGRTRALATVKALKIIVRATSLGGVESLIEHRASVEGEDSPIPDDLLRLSVGIEDPADLIADLEQALG